MFYIMSKTEFFRFVAGYMTCPVCKGKGRIKALPGIETREQYLDRMKAEISARETEIPF